MSTFNTPVISTVCASIDAHARSNSPVRRAFYPKTGSHFLESAQARQIPMRNDKFVEGTDILLVKRLDSPQMRFGSTDENAQPAAIDSSRLSSSASVRTNKSPPSRKIIAQNANLHLSHCGQASEKPIGNG
jgi:hypothetical protein